VPFLTPGSLKIFTSEAKLVENHGFREE